MFLAGGDAWKIWNAHMKELLLEPQLTLDCVSKIGWWLPAESSEGVEEHAVFATALNCLALETYYRAVSERGE